MRLVADTGVFSAALSQRRRPAYEAHVQRLSGNQIFLAAVTIAELRYGATVAAWGPTRRAALEQSIATTTVVPVTDSLLTTIAELRYACRQRAHPLADRIHAYDLWIAATAIHINATLITADNIFTDTPRLKLP